MRYAIVMLGAFCLMTMPAAAQENESGTDASSATEARSNANLIGDLLRSFQGAAEPSESAGSSQPEVREAAENADEEESLASQLVGTWKLVNAGGNGVRGVTRYKMFTGTHFVVTGVINETKTVRSHHGGRYSVRNNRLTSRVDFSTPLGREFLDEEFVFEIRIEDGQLYQTAVNSRFNEVWQKVSLEDGLE